MLLKHPYNSTLMNSENLLGDLRNVAYDQGLQYGTLIKELLTKNDIKYTEARQS